MSANDSSTSITGPQFEVELRRDVRIPTTDPQVTLSADVYLPVTAGQVPALVMALPYRKDFAVGALSAPTCRWLAAHGYASLLVDFRGTGSSDGVMRPPFDPGEADDAISAIDWAAIQPWCNGRIGMWGGSYGAIVAMRTASRRPRHLNAIIAIDGMLDPERDFVHPEGARGGLASLAMWGTRNLTLQLMPPLYRHHSDDEQRRWRERLNTTPPYLIDLFRHGPGDSRWRERVIDASAIDVPTLCVGGWQDLFCEGTVRAFEHVSGPKKLLMGPWMHTQPQDSPFEAIDFLPTALRWWDRWLRDIDNGVMDEPPVTLYLQGAQPEWRSFESWPPGKQDFVLATGTDTTLKETDGAAPFRDVIAEYQPDPTTGALSGLRGVPTTGFGLPLDQHDDDLRAVSATSEPLPDDLLITGRPEVTIGLADIDVIANTARRKPSAARLVVRLADVDPQGCSTLITAGLTSSGPLQASHRVVLWPTTYRLAAGHRLRVVISDSDFPRLWPLSEAPMLRVTSIELAAITLPEDAGAQVSMPAAPPPSPDLMALAVWAEPRWQIGRDLIKDAIDVVVGSNVGMYTLGREHLVDRRSQARATVCRTAPEAALFRTEDTALVRLKTGEAIEVKVVVRLTQSSLWVRGEVLIEGDSIFSHIWQS